MFNTVTPDNFNETLKGYLIRALKEANATEEERQKLFNGLRWAFSEMTMEDARKEYEKYCQGLIKIEPVRKDGFLLFLNRNLGVKERWMIKWVYSRNFMRC